MHVIYIYMIVIHVYDCLNHLRELEGPCYLLYLRWLYEINIWIFFYSSTELHIFRDK